jgi:hypothetical protein
MNAAPVWQKNPFGTYSYERYDLIPEVGGYKVMFCLDWPEGDRVLYLGSRRYLEEAQEMALQHHKANKLLKPRTGRWIDDNTWFSPYWVSD